MQRLKPKDAIIQSWKHLKKLRQQKNGSTPILPRCPGFPGVLMLALSPARQNHMKHTKSWLQKKTPATQNACGRPLYW